MKFSMTLSAGLALAGMTTAAPAPTNAADQIAVVAPASKSCASSTECRTNVQASQPFIDAFTKYNLKAPGQIAAVLALTAFESVNYQYKHNISPGRPGQGTSNMQMISYNIEYANSIPELKSKVAALGDISTPDKQNQLLALVTDDKYNFGSGPWFLTTKCSKDVVSGLEKGTDEAFAAYMGCVGVTVTDDRKAYWTRAKQAFNL
ncbi:hypothetical protein GGR51DRAFT_565455 [Nemania sp. FL0031]|nr:hypothetical protein GGR51DRAFT_565455 [Nemania sp. FL0031]